MAQIEKQTIFVNGLIVSSRGVLMVQRPETDRYLPGYFELPGGRIEVGESLRVGLMRKLSLELGIQPDIKESSYLKSYASVNTEGPYLRVFFTARVTTDLAFTIKLSSAHQKYTWFSSLDLDDLKVTDDATQALKEYFSTQPAANGVKKSTLIIFSDGGSRGNPGPSASAYAIYDHDMKLLDKGGVYLGITTNNSAEYEGVIIALEAAKVYSDKNTTVDFRMDSLLVVNQLSGTYKIKNRDLWPLNQEIKRLRGDFSQVHFRHIPREKNTVADGEVNRVLDDQPMVT